MKIGTIEKLCKSAKRILIVNDKERGIQWISDGYCMYPLLKLPRLTAENIFAIFDIPEDKQGKIYFDEREDFPIALDTYDSCDGESVISPEGNAILAGGRVLVPFKCAEGVMLIENKYLNVFDDDVTYYVRPLFSGRPYIVAKEGMFVSGIILPYEADYKLAEWLCEIGEGVSVMLDNKRVCGREEVEEEEAE